MGKSRRCAAFRFKGKGFACITVGHAIHLHQESNAVTVGTALSAQEGSTMWTVRPDDKAISRCAPTQGAGPGVFVKAFCLEALGREKGQNIFIHTPTPH